MNRESLREASEGFIRWALRQRLPPDVPVYLFGSRARGTARWNSDYDLWVDAELPGPLVDAVIQELDESFVPFKVDIVTTPQLRGPFGERVRSEARRWI